MGKNDEQYSELSRGNSFNRADLQLKKTDNEIKQLSIFDIYNNEEDNKAAEAGLIKPATAAFSLSEDQIADILRTGGGMKNSKKRIYAKYIAGKDPEYMAKFIKDEYRTTGKGFTIDGHQIAVWFDENGMTAGYGDSATEKPITKMTWSEVEDHIRRMV
ncbi:MAG: hypothetical protein K5894_14470, partial [Lachnospiraceae bacterium]|nr:hypothetical protein [Lachnospiraceae bacterium]